MDFPENPDVKPPKGILSIPLGAKKVLNENGEVLSPYPKTLWEQSLIASPYHPAEKGKIMGTEENKTIVSKMLEEVYNKQNPDAVARYLTADLVYHDPNLPQFRDLDGYKQCIRALKTAFTDSTFRIVIDDIIAEGDRVAFRWTCDHKGNKAEYFGIPPIDKPVKFTGVSVCRFVGDKIAEFWLSYDMLGALRQQGLIPPMGQG